MKRKVLALLAVALLAMSCVAVAFGYTVPSSTVVYVTPTGSKYHREDCTHIKNAYRTMTIAAAEAQGYGACSRCAPDERLGPYERNWDGSGDGDGVSSLPDGVVVVKPTKPKDKSFPWWTLYLLIPGYWIADWWRRDGRYWKSRRAEYAKLYEGKPAEELAGMPLWLEIGKDGLPKEKDDDGWGDTFTVYVTKNGRCFHTRRNCCRATTRDHIVRAKRDGRHACSKCGGALPDLRWYTEYQKIQRIKKKYGIE